MSYSVMLPRGESSIWRIVDDRGGVVFTGAYSQCEEWLDLADMRRSTGGSDSTIQPSTEMNNPTERDRGLVAVADRRPA
jgi:hypothetical protein